MTALHCAICHCRRKGLPEVIVCGNWGNEYWDVPAYEYPKDIQSKASGNERTEMHIE